MVNIEKMQTIRKILMNSRWSVDDILMNPQDEKQVSKYLDFIIMSAEIIIGNAYDVKSKLDILYEENNYIEALKVKIVITHENWLNIRINSLLPNNKIIGSAKLLEKCLIAELKAFSQNSKLPRFEKAFMVIIEHCGYNTCKSFDHDNKNLRVIPNSLKGLIFPDDNQFQLSISICTAYDENETYCDIYVFPNNDIEKFTKKHLLSL